MAEEHKVLHARIVTGSGGGPEKTILNSPRFLAGTAFPALACYLRDPDDPGFAVLRERAREAACPLIEVDDRRPLRDLPRILRELGRVIREHDVRIWHGHDYKSNLLGLLLRRKHKLRLVTTVHGWVKHTSRTPLYYAVDRWCLPRYEEVVTVSEDLRQRCLECGVREERLTLIENAIDTEYFRRDAPPASSPLRTDGGERLVIGAVGRLSPEKGFDLLVEAVEALIDEGLPLELRIAGEGDEQEALAARIAASPHAAHLKLLGFQADVRGLFAAFDVFCLSSLREGLPNVVLEAMAMEVPVLATRCGGMEAFARDGEDALLVPTGSADALRDGLRRLAQDAGLRADLARAARARIEAEQSFRRRMERMVTVYERLRTD